MTLNVNSTTTIAVDEIELTVAVAVQFTAPNITVTIAPAILVSAPLSTAVASGQNGSSLINNGSITGGTGISFNSNNATITNNAGRTIAGNNDGIFYDGDGATITNAGTVAGYTAAGVTISAASSAFVLNNSGEIYGRDTGVFIRGPSTINNSGLINSEGDGLLLSSNALTTPVHNSATGIIKGADDAITTAGMARLVLDNRGTIAGDIDLNASTGNVNDVVVNKGKITGDVLLGPGNDVFNGNGGTATKVFGEAGNDTLIGGKGSDVLHGGAGLDLIRGGRGRDVLFGESERDLFDFNSIKDSLKGAKRDVIQDFVHGNNVTGDDIDLRTIDARTGVGGNQAFKFIGKSDFHDKKGELRYIDKGASVIVQGDVNGDGKADFEILVKVGALSAGDFLL